MAEWPRQPRANLYSNLAQRNISTVQLRDSSGAWNNAFVAYDTARADTIVATLNSIFAIPGADLDFITPGFDNGNYVVLWSGVTWDNSLSVSTTTGNGSKTYEQLYKGSTSRSDIKIICTISDYDCIAEEKKPWEIAFNRANAIRNIVNGWNCTKDATLPQGQTLYSNGTIPQLSAIAGKYAGPVTSLTATIFGKGETLPSFYTGNTNIFHTCDLVIARPKAKASDSNWAYNKWIQISRGTTSVMARIVDQSGGDNIDLSIGGVAYALNMSGTQTVTVSPPPN